MKAFFQSIFRIFFTKKGSDYHGLSDEEYLQSFGVRTQHGQDCEKDKIKSAYDRAWINRDFEIDKFWTRAAYFWGFIVLIFGAYFSLLTSEKIESGQLQFFQFCLICLGLIFSIAWCFVIKGSKHWQENWERHIDMLEDYVSGPLYKTIYHNGSFYSVSKINLILSHAVIAVWILFFINFAKLNFCFEPYCGQVNWMSVGIFSITCLCIASIVLGYAKKSFSNKQRIFIRRKPSDNLA